MSWAWWNTSIISTMGSIDRRIVGFASPGEKHKTLSEK
jgi:hypothetical protein